MAIKALTLAATRVYESKYDPDKGSDKATRWTIGTIDSRVMGKLLDKATTVMVDPNKPNDDVATTINQHEQEFELCQFGLKGVENFVDAETEQEIPYKTVKRNLGGVSYEVMSAEILRRVPQVVLAELAAEVRKDNELPEVVKNG